MTLRAKPFERTTRRLISEEIRRNPKLQPETMRFRTDANLGSFAGLAIISFVSAIAWFMNAQPHAGLASLSITILGWILFDPGRWIAPFYRNQDLWVLTHLPFSVEAIWAVQWHRNRAKIITLILTLAVTYFACALTADWNLPLAMLPIIAVPQAILTLALGVHLAAYPIPIAIPWPTLGLLSAVPLTVFGAWKFGWIESPPFGAVYLLPTSWFHNVALAAVGEYSSLHFLWLLPAGAIIALLPRSIVRLRFYFHWWLHYIFTAEAQAEADAETPEPEKIPIHDEGGDRVVGPTALIDATLSGISLAPPAFQTNGFVEKLVFRFFNERERTLAGFVWFGGVRWSRGWMISATWLIGVAIAVVLASHFVSAKIAYAAGLGIVVVLGDLPIFRVGARGLEHWQISPGLAAALYSGFPIGYSELARTLAKAALVRFVCSLPQWIIYGTIVGATFGPSWLVGATIGIKSWLIVLLLQPIIIVRWLSDSIAMSQKGSNITLGLVFVFVWCGLPGLIVPFAMSNLPAYYGLVIVTAIISFGIFFYHRALYRRGGLDCVKPPPAEF